MGSVIKKRRKRMSKKHRSRFKTRQRPCQEVIGFFRPPSARGGAFAPALWGWGLHLRLDP